MKQVTLKRLTAQNFRSKTFDFEFGQVNAIKGKNRVGKTTVKNAFFWLLTGADDHDRTNYNLFDTTVVHTKENSVPTVVTGLLNIDGVDFELSRTAKMGWIRKRGNTEYERKPNDDYSFSVDGIERTATEYKSWIEDMFAPVEILKCALNTRHFLYNLPDWKTQRQLLSAIAGEISNEEFTGDYEELFAQFSKYTPEQLHDRLKNLLSPLKKALGTDSIKGEKMVELETLQKSLPDLKNIEEAESELVLQKERKSELQEMIKGKLSPLDDAREAQRKAYAEISKKENEIHSLRRKYEETQGADAARLKRELEDVNALNAQIAKKNERAKKDFDLKQKQIKVNEDNIKAWSLRLEELREENIAIKNRVFTDTTCSYCGAPLPEDKLAEQKANFEERKEKDRLDNAALGKQLKFRIETTQADLDTLKKEVEEGLKQDPYTDTSALEEKLQMANASYPPFEQTEEYKQFAAEVERMKAEVPEMPVIDTSELDEKIKNVDDKISGLMLRTSMRPHYESQVAQINSLRASIREMAQERASLEKIEQQLTAYEQEKADIVGKRVNRFFEKCEVSMFSEKKDGSLTPNCVITMDGGRSATLNKEGTITAGVDVSNAFCQYADINMPLFIDDNESLSDDNKIHSLRQTITLSVGNGELELIKN